MKILKQCKEAIKGREGGKVIIIDMVVENNKVDAGSTETHLCFDMLDDGIVHWKRETRTNGLSYSLMLVSLTLRSPQFWV